MTQSYEYCWDRAKFEMNKNPSCVYQRPTRNVRVRRGDRIKQDLEQDSHKWESTYFEWKCEFFYSQKYFPPVN